MQSVNVVPNTDGSNTMVVVVQNQGSVNTGNGFATDLYLNHQPTGPGDDTGSVNSWGSQSILLEFRTLRSPLPFLRRAIFWFPDRLHLRRQLKIFYVQADLTGALTKDDQSNLTITGPISVCTAKTDIYEDNSAATAKAITVNVAQVHNFNSPGDQDWAAFTAKKGVTYTLNTSNLGPNADTYWALYSTDGTTLLTSNDDYNGNASIPNCLANSC